MSKRSRLENEPEASQSSQEEGRKRLENVIPELIKRAVIGGYDKASEAQESIKHFISESKLPKEITSSILNQVDETKRGLFRVVGKEIRRFLEAIDLQRELQKLLSSASIEIKTEIRFVPNALDNTLKAEPQVKSEVLLKKKSAQEPTVENSENAIKDNNI